VPKRVEIELKVSTVKKNKRAQWNQTSATLIYQEVKKTLSKNATLAKTPTTPESLVLKHVKTGQSQVRKSNIMKGFSKDLTKIKLKGYPTVHIHPLSKELESHKKSSPKYLS
jgi:hypothetical protein